MATDNPGSPLLQAKTYAEPSVFQPENLLREARRQKTVPDGTVHGDLRPRPGRRHRARRCCATGRARRNPFWACYHTDMYDVDLAGETVSIVGCAVGAPFAVLVAEQMFASGCRIADQHHLVRSDHPLRANTVFHPDRAGAARRGHQPSLPAAFSIRRRRPGPDRQDRRWPRRSPPARPPGCDLDHGRAVPRNRSRDRGGPHPRRARGGNGSRRPLCIRRRLATRKWFASPMSQTRWPG